MMSALVNLPTRSVAFWEKRFGILLWNLLELFEGFERVFLSSGFQRLLNSGLELFYCSFISFHKDPKDSRKVFFCCVRNFSFVFCFKRKERNDKIS